ncbi:MAG: hypothetical protein ABI980_11445, partial [Nitrospirota bacterium]
MTLIIFMLRSPSEQSETAVKIQVIECKDETRHSPHYSRLIAQLCELALFLNQLQDQISDRVLVVRACVWKRSYAPRNERGLVRQRTPFHMGSPRLA